MKLQPSLLSVSLLLLAHSGPLQCETGAWSEEANGLQGRLSVSEGKTFNGTQLLDVYLELRNVSDVLNPIEIYYDTLHPILSCEIVDAEGKAVARRNGPASIMQPPSFWLVLPHDSLLRFKVSVSGYGIPKDAGDMVQMTCGDWVLKPNEGNRFLQVVVSSTSVDEETGRRAWHGTLTLPKVRIAP